MMISNHGKKTSLSGLGMYQDQQGLPRKFYKEQCKLRREKKGPTKEALGE